MYSLHVLMNLLNFCTSIFAVFNLGGFLKLIISRIGLLDLHIFIH